MRVIVGQDDEVFYADRFAGVFEAAGKSVPVTLLPGIDHIALSLDPVAIRRELPGTVAVGAPDPQGQLANNRLGTYRQPLRTPPS